MMISLLNIITFGLSCDVYALKLIDIDIWCYSSFIKPNTCTFSLRLDKNNVLDLELLALRA